MTYEDLSKRFRKDFDEDVKEAYKEMIFGFTFDELIALRGLMNRFDIKSINNKDDLGSLMDIVMQARHKGII